MTRLPDGAIPADLSQQVPNNSYSPPPLYYVDKAFQCVDCGRKEVWTAEDQKWYYEVAKGSLYARAVRCLECRRKRAELYADGDPYPVKHLGTLMKRLCEAIHPTLESHGFQLDRKIAITFTDTGILEFSRSDEIIAVSYQRPQGKPRLVVESVTEAAGYLLIDSTDLTPTGDILAQIQQIASTIERYLDRDSSN